MKRLYTKLIYLGFVLLLFNQQSLIAQTSVYVNPNQVLLDDFEGWGTSMAWWAEDAGDYHKNDEAKIDSLSKMLIEDLNFTTFRYNIGGSCDEDKESNCPTINQGVNPQRLIPNMGAADRGLNQRRMLKSIAKIGQANSLPMKFETFSNSPPYWMLKSGSPTGGYNGQNNLKDDQYEAFAKYLVTATGYINDDLAPYGFDVESIEPFNEPLANWWRFHTNNNPGKQEGCSFSLENQYKMINALYEEMNAQGSTAFIAANDNFKMDPYVIEWYEQYGLIGKIGRLNFHDYQGSTADRANLKSMAETLGKDLWVSEGGLIGIQWPGNAYSFQLGFMQRISEDLKYLRPKRWVDWQVMDTDASWTAIDYYEYMNNGNLIPNKRFYMMQHFTKHFNIGDDEMFSSTDVGSVTAYRSQDQTQLSIVIVNTNATSQAFEVDLSDFNATSNASVEYWLTDKNSNNHTQQSNISLNAAGQLNITMGAETIATFVVPIGSGSTTSQCTATSLSPYYNAGNGWASGTNITIDAGTTITFGPQQTAGGSWSWSGMGLMGSDREQTITPVNSGTATASFTNHCGETSVIDFNITVNSVSCPSTTISPNVYFDGSWSQQTSFTVESGSYVKFGPYPNSGGSWEWTVCGISSNVSARELILYPTSSCTVTATYTNVCGTQSTLDFIITVDETLTNGTYRIINKNSGKCLTTSNASPTNGAQVVQKTIDNNDSNQEWIITDIGSGIYTIVHAESGLYADINGQSTTAGASNILWSSNGGNNQKWNILSQGEGDYQIQNVNSQLLLDIAGAGTHDGAWNIQWSDNGGDNQSWSFVEVQNSSARVRQSELSETNSVEVVVYPNPVTDGEFNIHIPEHFINGQLTISDINGKQFYKKDINSNKENIDTEGFTPGIYIIIISNNNKVISKKILVSNN
ncbi:RICIN domain-containing protein [Flammeovirga sp. EKP202]|nr:RICIN domain-containing protein [Flammeovirga sp. EKP202]